MSNDPNGVYLDDEWYPSVEHAYQASRFVEPEIRDKIRSARTGGTATAWGELWPTSVEDWDLMECSILSELRAQVVEDFDELI